MSDPTTLSARAVAEAVRGGALSAREVTEAHLARIRAVDPHLGAFLLVTEALARQMADAVDARRRAGASLGPLAGVPVALKDVLSTKGVQTTCASRVLASYVPAFDATVVERLRAADAVFVGKTNLDEFAMGSSTENSAFGPTRNPWDRARTPGGSSGGSAVAVAARMATVALGTDTGGSIRQPAALTGITGLKPTYGRVSRWGLVAFASSLDQIGPFARSAADAALVLSVIGGHDPRDSTSASRTAPELLGALGAEGLAGVRLGVPREYFAAGLEPEVERSVRAAIGRLEGLGATIREIGLPHTEHALAVYYLVSGAEASSNLARFDGVRYGLRAEGATPAELTRRTRDAGFGPEVKRRILLGTYALSSGYYDQYYGKAQRVRSLIARDFEAAFREVDAIVAPTSPTVAFELGSRVDDPLAMYQADVLTLPASLAGLPAVSIPCGFGREGLPVGLQIVGAPFDEATVLRVADTLQQSAPELAGAPPEVAP